MSARKQDGAPGPSWGRQLRRTLITAVIGCTGGLLGVIADVPAGPLLGSLIFVGVYNVVSDGRADMVPVVRDGARILTGTTIGSLATATLLSSVGAFLPWVLGATLLIIGFGLACGLLFARWTGIDRSTALLAYAPGGFAEMSAIAQDLGGRTELVVGIHLVRKIATLLTVVAIIAALGQS
jgi:uncharacterized protein